MTAARAAPAAASDIARPWLAQYLPGVGASAAACRGARAERVAAGPGAAARRSRCYQDAQPSAVSAGRQRLRVREARLLGTGHLQRRRHGRAAGEGKELAATGTISVPIASADIVNRGDDGADLSFGTPGGICIRGSQVTAGYWKRPGENFTACKRPRFIEFRADLPESCLGRVLRRDFRSPGS